MRGNHHGAPGQRPHGSHYYGQNGSGRPSNRRPRNFGSSDSYSPASNAALSSFGNLSVRDRQSGSYAEGADTTAKKQLKVLPPELRTEPGLPRRAFLHIVVLFASDPRVMAYATGVAEMFRAAGVDVWLMTELSKGGNTDGSGSYQQGPRWIKPENLVSLITASKADSLIVIGDRNMKNETCQVSLCFVWMWICLESYRSDVDIRNGSRASWWKCRFPRALKIYSNTGRN